MASPNPCSERHIATGIRSPRASAIMSARHGLPTEGLLEGLLASEFGDQFVVVPVGEPPDDFE